MVLVILAISHNLAKFKFSYGLAHFSYLATVLKDLDFLL